MPRLNIEDDFWDEITEVAVRMGDTDKAIGQALKWLRFGQKKFRDNKKIRYDEFKEKFSDALMPEFARRDGEFVEVVGASKHFGWLKKKQEAGAKGGSAPKKPNPPPKPSETKQTEANGSTEEQTEASSSPSYSPSELKALAAVSLKETPATEFSESGGAGTVIPALSNNSLLLETLRFIPADVQRSWIDRWTPRSVSDTLLNGVEHYLTEYGGKAPREIDDWAGKLVKWIRSEKVTLIERPKPKPESAKEWKSNPVRTEGGRERALAEDALAVENLKKLGHLNILGSA